MTTKKKLKPAKVERKPALSEKAEFRCTTAELKELQASAEMNGRKVSGEIRFRCFLNQ